MKLRILLVVAIAAVTLGFAGCADPSASLDDTAVAVHQGCGDIVCQTNADCPGSCGGCSEWSKTCLAF